MPQKTIKTDKGWIIYDPSLINDINDELFEPSHSVNGESKLGRGQVIFFTLNNRDWVLKHYQRGGLIQKLSRDSYIYTGLAKTRMAAEFHLLQKMSQLELPVPKVMACRIQRNGLSYRGDIITEKIAQPSTLAEIIETQELSPERWQQVGELIGQFHQQGIYHADLNANNIMQSGHESSAPLFLIDFDRGEQRAFADTRWPQDNLDRLKRSFEKLQGKALAKERNFYFSDSSWQQLISGYNASINSSSH